MRKEGLPRLDDFLFGDLVPRLGEDGYGVYDIAILERVLNHAFVEDLDSPLFQASEDAPVEWLPFARLAGMNVIPMSLVAAASTTRGSRCDAYKSHTT